MFNTVISFEEIPNYLKTSLIKPIYKGKGKEPLETSSFRRVSLSSMIAKLHMKPIPYLSSLPGCGSGMLMTLSASSGRAQPKNSYTISIGWGQADHQVHCGAGRRWDTPVPQHVTQKERGWKPRQLYLPEAMHMDGYLHFESHHPAHMKRGVVRCLTTRPERSSARRTKEVDHMAQVLKQNGYPANFIRNASAPPTQETADTSSHDEEQEKGKGSLVVIPG